MPEHDIHIAGHCVLCGTGQYFPLPHNTSPRMVNKAWLAQCYRCNFKFLIPEPGNPYGVPWNETPIIGKPTIS